MFYLACKTDDAFNNESIGADDVVSDAGAGQSKLRQQVIIYF